MAASTQAIASLALADPAGAIGLTDGLPLIGLAALAWLFTYALHSTLLLSSAWIATRRMSDSRAGLRERVWKFAVLAAFVTASVQTGMGFEPLGGRLPLHQDPALARDDARSAPESSVQHEWDVAAVRELTTLSINPLLGSALFAKLALADLDLGPAWTAQSLLQESASAPESVETATLEARDCAQASGAPVASVAALPWSSKLGGWTQWAFGTAALGAFAGLCLFGLLWLRLNGCLRDRVELEHGVLFERLHDLRRRSGMRRPVRLSVAPSLGAPISMGMFFPEICVPPRVLLELSEEEQEALLAHELAHVVRRDPLWLAICRLCEGVFFFQPLNRVARREIEDCAEFLSDAWAVRHTGLRFSLASCLTRIAEWIVGDRRSLPAPAMAHGRSRLRHRVELLLDESAAESVDRHPRWLGFACTGFCATLVAVVPCVSAREHAGQIGDGALIPFLPDREMLDAAPVSEKPSEDKLALEASDSSQASAGTVASTAASVSRVAPSAGFDQLKRELDGLADEIALLREEASALQLEANDARDVSGEFAFLEMKLARLRELSSRLERLRASPRATLKPPTKQGRELSNLSALPPTMNPAPAPSVNRKEPSK